jgi:hypothetical protein
MQVEACFRGAIARPRFRLLFGALRTDMAGKPSTYHRGEMDIHEQSRTYHSFLLLSKWGSLTLMVGLLFFAMLFCTKAGFIASAASAFVLAVVGILLLRERKIAAH